jgi:hypothetical protein
VELIIIDMTRDELEEKLKKKLKNCGIVRDI